MVALGEVTLKINADTDDAQRKLRALRHSARMAGLVSPYFVLLGVLLGFVLGLAAAVVA